MQTEIEKHKLDSYFPAEKAEKNEVVNKLRYLRWRYEFKDKIESLFPRTIAVGNLFSSASLFEYYLMLFVNELGTYISIPFSESRGNGFSRFIDFLRRNGFKPEASKLFNQVDSIICIRNSLYHASGYLDWSRERAKIKGIVKDKSYLASAVARHRRANGIDFNELRIVDSENGDRLHIENEFSHYAASMFRDYFSFLYKDVHQELNHRSGSQMEQDAPGSGAG